MDTIAAIDIGSNTVLLQIARASANGRLTSVLTAQHTPRLSSGISSTGKISSDSASKLVTALLDFGRLCNDHRVTAISCYGTSAMREAENSKEIVERVKAATGIVIKVISGRKEGALSYLGAITGISKLRRDRLVVDVGGGSSEVVVGKDVKIITARSFKIGAVKLTEELRLDRKLTPDGLTAALESIRHRIQALNLPCASIDASLICSGGTPTTLAGFKKKLTVYDSSAVHGSTLRTEEIRQLVCDLACKSRKDKVRALPFDPRRADVITAGGLLIIAFAEHYGFERVRVSDRSLRFGQLRELIGDEVEFA